jgi:dienelactone hydrolase
MPMTYRETAYTSEGALLERFDQHSRTLGLRATDVAQLDAWRVALQDRLRAITGLDTMHACQLDAREDEPARCDGYLRTQVVIHVEPGVAMPLYVLTPADIGPGERRAVVIAPHGHGGGGKETVAGRAEHPALADAIRRYRYDYGVQLARSGFVVLCPDARGFGERRERVMLADDDVLGGSCQVLNNMALPLGRTVTGMWVWDLMRLIDYAETRPDCDMQRLACAGLSGGGLQTLWLAALDERVRCAVVSGYFYGYKDALLRMSRNCSCNYVPGLWQLADMGDLGALIAPRPLLVESGRFDPLNGERGVENVVEQLAITRRAYELLGAPDRVAHTIFDGEHRWDGAEVVPWLRRWLVAAPGG